MRLISKDREFYKAVIRLALPIGLQSLITLSVNLADTVMVGQLGEVSLSAVSLANQFISTYQASCLGIGMGASVLISRFYGGKDREAVKRTVTVMLRFTVFFGLIFTLAAAAWPGFLMGIYTGEEEIVRQGVSYLRLSAFSYVIHGLTLTATLVLRSVGKSGIPMISSAIAFLINLGGNYVFIFGKFGLLSLGVWGAALSTLLARVFEFIFVAGYLFFFDRTVGYRVRDIFGKCSSVAGEYFRIGLPVFASEGLLALGNNVLAMVMGRMGSSFVSANAITTVTQQLSTVLLQGLSQSGCILVGQTLGREKRGKLRKVSGVKSEHGIKNEERGQAAEQAWAMLGLGILIGVVGGTLILCSSDFVISVYRVTEETAAVARQMMRVMALIVIFQSVDSVLTKGVLRGGGDTRFLLLADVLFLWIASVPLGFLAGLVWGLPAFWTYFLLKIDRIICCVWCLWRLRSEKWIREIDAEKKR
ncbi:MAG: MATE family efflux transporter [Lachnospiraceae bacterium]|nr:MATE family efflux transporter [Lachnospiraceae bacterium]